VTSWRSEELLVGLITLALVPLIGLRIARGLREGRLPLYRTWLERDQDRLKFGLLLVLHGISLLMVSLISADLLLGLGLRER
jgi:hypothetical protein